jgi:hypothetical protein
VFGYSLGMTERYDDAVDSGRPISSHPISTGEFRATPDISASTAQFRAFAEDSSEPARAWDMGVPGRSPARVAVLVAGAIIVVAIIAILVFILA